MHTVGLHHLLGIWEYWGGQPQLGSDRLSDCLDGACAYSEQMSMAHCPSGQSQREERNRDPGQQLHLCLLHAVLHDPSRQQDSACGALVPLPSSVMTLPCTVVPGLCVAPHLREAQPVVESARDHI
jgi:hypothetical protein